MKQHNECPSSVTVIIQFDVSIKELGGRSVDCPRLLSKIPQSPEAFKIISAHLLLDAGLAHAPGTLY